MMKEYVKGRLTRRFIREKWTTDFGLMLRDLIKDDLQGRVTFVVSFIGTLLSLRFCVNKRVRLIG